MLPEIWAQMLQGVPITIASGCLVRFTYGDQKETNQRQHPNANVPVVRIAARVVPLERSVGKKVSTLCVAWQATPRRLLPLGVLLDLLAAFFE